MKSVVSIVGPTASGKTGLSVALAGRYDAEIVSMDSMQIYRGMDIGTAKVTPAEMQGIPHYMIDIADPNSPYSVQQFVLAARKCVDDILSRGKMCILVGGTGLYLEHLIQDTKFADIPTDFELRERLNRIAQDELWAMLEQKDPASAARLHPNDKKRIVRALEVVELSGKTVGEWDKISHIGSKPLDVDMIGLAFDNRDVLYNRINNRVDLMLQNGLVEEVSNLAKSDEFRRSNAADAIGYKEILLYLDGQISLDEAIELIKLNTRHYAKRQYTWFRRYPNICWISVDSSADLLQSAIQFVERN